MKTLQILFKILTFCCLTILTQIGGLVYLLTLLSYRWIDKYTDHNIFRISIKLTTFLTFYLITTLWIIPPMARRFGRVPLPITETTHLKALNKLTCLLNRNYVTPQLRQTAFHVAQQMGIQYPGTTLNYLDANFPFFVGFPLFPHLSHNDGKKLDLAFCYRDALTRTPTHECPSFIGYGICEEPLPYEENTSQFCKNTGAWQYSFLKTLTPQGRKKDFIFDATRTRKLVILLANQPNITKIFIEPHLKNRLKLTSDKIKFQGCHAVRHDDHIHVQVE